MRRIICELPVIAAFCVIIYMSASYIWTECTSNVEEPLSGQIGPRIVERVPFAVKVSVDKLLARCSGTLIRGDLVLTSYNVIRDRKNGEAITVKFHDGFEREASLVKSDKVLGLVLLRIKPVLYPSAAPALLRATKKDSVTIYGFSVGEISAQVIGEVVAYRAIRRGSPRDTFLVNNKCLPGMVGGPVLNSSGDLVGILYGSWVYSNCTDLLVIKKFLSGAI